MLCEPPASRSSANIATSLPSRSKTLNVTPEADQPVVDSIESMTIVPVTTWTDKSAVSKVSASDLGVYDGMRCITGIKSEAQGGKSIRIVSAYQKKGSNAQSSNTLSQRLILPTAFRNGFVEGVSASPSLALFV
jgi:hypothetical protein